MSSMLNLLLSIPSVHSSITLIGVHEHALEDKLRLLRYNGMNANVITNGENNRIKKLLHKYKNQVKKTKFADKNEINNILQKIKRNECDSENVNNESNLNFFY